MLHWLRRFAPRVSRSAYSARVSKRPPRACPGVEPLEDRWVPAVNLIRCDLVNLLPMVVDDASLDRVEDLVCSRMPTVSVSLAAASDTGTAGDLRTNLATVDLVGQTGAGFRVRLLGTAITTTADAQGRFTLSGVSLMPGINDLIVRVTDDGGNIGQTGLSVTRNSAPTVQAAPQDVTVMENAENTVLNLADVFRDVDVRNSIVRLQTSGGLIDIELFDQNGPASAPTRTTPLTVANFLRYVTDGDYRDTIFHRLVPNFVLQGGGFRFDEDTHTLPAIPTDPPVQNEPGISNVRGTVAMAKLGGDPNSATSQFFFNLGDNSANLDNQNGGFTVFGQVIGDGMQVVDRLASIPTQNRGGVFTEIPLIDFPRTAAFPADLERENLALVESATVRHLRDVLTFTVSNTNPTLVQATVSGNTLTLDYQENQSGTAIITLRATDREGAFVETSFRVTVQDAG
ncbi:MAG TPA: peptidylprolyl isomerase [Gemmataceae bacterium]|nr:peptidylprolyl isomerase [Gemmataceae bacterium]